jgi:hypothetical protein
MFISVRRYFLRFLTELGLRIIFRAVPNVQLLSRSFTYVRHYQDGAEWPN